MAIVYYPTLADAGGDWPQLYAVWNGPGLYDLYYTDNEGQNYANYTYVGPYAPPAPPPPAPTTSTPTSSGSTSGSTTSSGSTAPSTGSGTASAPAATAPAATSAPAATAAPSATVSGASTSSPEGRRRMRLDFGPAMGYTNEGYTEYANMLPEFMYSNPDSWYRGAGYYDIVDDMTGYGLPSQYSYLGANNPDEVLSSFGGRTGEFTYRPGEGWVGAYTAPTRYTEFGMESDTYDPYRVDASTAYGAINRDQFLQNFYAPYANVPGVRSPDEFVQHRWDDPSVFQVTAGSENVSEAGRENIDLGYSLNILNAYMNQPALLEARGGQRFDWREVPQLADAYAQQYERAKGVAQGRHDINTKGIDPMELAMFAASLWAPGAMAAFAPAFAAGTAAGGLTGGGLGAGASTAGSILSGATAAGSAMPWQSLLGRGLSIIDPRLGQIASIGSGLSGLSGMLGGPTLSSLAGALDPTTVVGSLSNASDFGGGNFGLGTTVVGDLSNAADFGSGAFGLGSASLDAAENLFRAPVDQLATQAGLDAAMGGAAAAGGMLGGAASGMNADPYGNTDMGYGPTGTVAPEGLPSADAASMSVSDVLGGAQKAYSLYQQVSKLLGDDSVDAQQRRGVSAVPQRTEEQTDREYAETVADWAVDYLDIDAGALAKAGLEPGSDEYLNYILQQADSIIAQIFGRDPSALQEGETIEDLQGALRELTRKELQQLERALFVRGQLGQLMGAGDYLDPFTGTTETVEGAGLYNPNVAAYQRGIARSTEDLAGLTGADARQYLGGMLGRKADLFGLQSAADARLVRARMMAELENLPEEERRRRMAELGLDGSGQVDWARAFERVDDRAAEDLFRGIEGDRAQSALLQAIFGE